MQLSGDETKHTTVGDVKIVQNQTFSLLGLHPRANDPGRWEQQTNWKFRKQILFLFYFVFSLILVPPSSGDIVAPSTDDPSNSLRKNKTFLPKNQRREFESLEMGACVRYIISVCQSRALLLPIYNE